MSLGNWLLGFVLVLVMFLVGLAHLWWGLMTFSVGFGYLWWHLPEILPHPDDQDPPEDIR